MKLCQAPPLPDRSPCPCVATHGDLCAAHASTATRVPYSKTTPPPICARCGRPIKPGTFQKSVGAGRVEHGGYVCTPKEAQ